ncbi:hypothetical protein DICVIV_07842 [Dictyocaulus viviparus]|uniref:Queuosine 5'-phosphate N-glycosylase/hydrolase n=1 Tax=Dictyocaulus viviparus TaxID=29172 RepID=A0A0D8XNI0_DICVI|nr:hypothetical protein DICVIV_07842 [Dictyocaulus viviparus]
MERVLSPLDSGRFIMEHANLIKINEEGVQKVARMILDSVNDGSIANTEFTSQVLHPKGEGKSTVDWIFLVDTINFSFWPDKGSKYEVTYNGIKYTGYFALCAAVNKALALGLNITSAEWMANARQEDVDQILKSDGGYSIPLLVERVKAINESGSVLLKKWNGSFYNCIEAAKCSAMKLLHIIVENFESFRDFAVFRGQKVSFLKRAQILVADVYAALKDECSEDLTMFADYRVPQALAYLGVLEYSEELMHILRNGNCLPNGSAEEVEIRGASIWACENYVVMYVCRYCCVVSFSFAHIIPVRMFKKFDEKEDVTGATQLKSSIQKGIRNKLIESYPQIEPYLAEILPKKENFKLIKCRDHIELIADHNGVVQFLKTRNTDWVPTLRLLHKYPFILPHQQVDKGAIKFVLNGSSIMCPGLTSPGGKMTPGLAADTIVAIMAEGKQHALAIGQMKMSSEDIQSVNKGVGIDNLHYLTDGLWRLAEKSLN